MLGLASPTANLEGKPEEAAQAQGGGGGGSGKIMLPKPWRGDVTQGALEQGH